MVPVMDSQHFHARGIIQDPVQTLSLITIQPGQRVLDLGCRNARITALAASRVGRTGEVVGIYCEGDVPDTARAHLSQFPHVTLHEGNITTLPYLQFLVPESFDIIICTSMFHYLGAPSHADTLSAWLSFLKPGGHMLVDVPHPRRDITQVVLERVSRRLENGEDYLLQRAFQFRSWITSEDSLMNVLESAGFTVVKRETLPHDITKETHPVSSYDAVFASKIHSFTEVPVPSGFRLRGKTLFDEELARFAVGGQVEEVSFDAVYVCIARKAGDLQPPPPPPSSASSPPKPLRPALHILNRIQWDPAYEASEYLVGCKERFDGFVEIPLENFKTDTTHEEFIPQHRVAYVKKRDGEIVWHRDQRIDAVYWSGRGGLPG